MLDWIICSVFFMERNAVLLRYNKWSSRELFMMDLGAWVCYCGWNLIWYFIRCVLEWSVIYLYEKLLFNLTSQGYYHIYWAARLIIEKVVCRARVELLVIYNFILLFKIFIRLWAIELNEVIVLYIFRYNTFNSSVSNSSVVLCEHFLGISC